VVAVAWPEGTEPRPFEGIQEGSIALTPRGERGFGYDPVFLVDGERVQAEISDDEKDLISHRGKAVRAAVAWLAERYP
jgi:XTP/dITP diphosphohydrolase